jgi:hypothetical protein
LQAAAVKLAASDLDSGKTIASSVPKSERWRHEGRIGKKYSSSDILPSLAEAGGLIAC